MTAPAVVLQVEQIERRFGGLVALTGVDLKIQRGEIFGLVGPNGSGKTTLTNAITGFYPPQKGRITLEGHDITGMAPHAVARRGVARTFHLLETESCRRDSGVRVARACQLREHDR